MQKVKTAFITLILVFTLIGVRAQSLHIGSSVISLGFNGSSYSFTSTNLCATTTSSGSLPAFIITPSYSYAVLYKLTIDGSLGIPIYVGGTGLDIGLGVTYHIFFPAHSPNPFQALLIFKAGFTTIGMNNSSISDAGKFVSNGIFYTPGLGIRKYFLGNFGLFADINYAIYNYTGGQVQQSDSYKLPFTLTFSGLTYGGGICLRLIETRQGNATTY
jgi:hypothetical protein